MIKLPRTAAKLFLALQIPFAFACSGAGPAGSADPTDGELAGLLTFASDPAAGDAFRAGTALADARIDLVRDGRAVRSVVTGATGAFSSTLPPGAYTVRIALADGPPLEFALAVAAGDALFAEGRVDQNPSGAFALNVQVFRDANADAQPDDEFRFQVLDRVQGDDGSGFEDVVEGAEEAEALVTVCHVPPGNPDAAHTVDVGAPSVPAHLAHGDAEGACADDAGEEENPEDDPGEDEESDEAKVLVCHAPPGNPENAHTVEVGESAVPAHLAHGDTEGACEGDDSPGEEDPEGEDEGEETEEETKVAVCHVPPGNPENPHTVEIGESAVPAHLAHGDTEGACVEETPPAEGEVGEEDQGGESEGEG